MFTRHALLIAAIAMLLLVFPVLAQNSMVFFAGDNLALANELVDQCTASTDGTCALHLISDIEANSVEMISSRVRIEVTVKILLNHEPRPSCNQVP